MGQTVVLLKIPQANGNFFAGDASASAVFTVIFLELLSNVVFQCTLLVNGVVRARMDRNFRNVLWKKILHLKSQYFDRVPASTLISRITIDTESLNEFVIDVVIGEFLSLFTLGATITAMSSINWKAALLMMAFVPVSILFSFIMGRFNMKFGNLLKGSMANLTEYLSELIASLPIVKAFNKQNYEDERGRKVINNYYISNKRLIILDLVRQILSTVIGLGPDICLIVIGINLLNKNAITVAGWYAFYMYTGSITSFFSQKGSVWESIKSVQGRLLRVSLILSEPEEGVEPYIKEAVDSGDIVFDKVSFGYEDKKVINKISFTIPKNKITAIVGYSGTGKSTILKLLERLYNPSDGRILLNGVELKDYSIKEWRNKIAYVTQNTPMISGTIRENILYGIHREVKDEEIMEAAKLAYVDKFINSCPEGLDYQVGQFGDKLSGGQRQKLSIARAILRNADYLILDEPTASLDMVSANEVSQAIENLKNSKTIIMVAHSARAIMDVDHIVVLDEDSSVVEGTDEELKRTNEFYRQLMEA
jgi:ATP-binding cassette subfamily B protein AbcA/BmrA